MSSVLTENIGGALVIRLNRPEQRNPLSSDVIDRLFDLILGIDKRSTTRLVITGSGDVFASGADLREIDRLTPDSAAEFAGRGQSLMDAIDELSIPVIAAVNGYCFGGGLDLALACDIRIASPNALFCHPGVSLGIMTGWGGTQRLPRLIGQGVALEMLMTASRIPANEAQRFGLVDQISDDVLAAALNLTLSIV
jgi:enoyl-CoA hydratase